MSEERQSMVTPMMAYAFHQVDQTTGVSLDQVRRQAEESISRNSPPRGVSVRPPKPQHFFLLVRDGLRPGELTTVTRLVSSFCRVLDSGVGVASSADLGWLEVSCRASDVATVREKLRDCGINDRVVEVLEIAPGEGKTQAKQLHLIDPR